MKNEKFVQESAVFSKNNRIFATNNFKITFMDNKPLNRIKVVMAERMVSNKDLSEMLNKDTATISRWVTNTSQPTLESLIEIAKALKCDIGDLVRMDDSTILKNQD